MVMAVDTFDCGRLYQLEGADKEEGVRSKMCGARAEDAAALHERLVAHALAVGGDPDSRLGVWGEHSYARPRGPAANTFMRTLLAPRAPDPDPDDELDVVGEPRAPPAPPLDGEDEDDDEPSAGDEAEDDEWEERLAGLAPSAAHARLAAAVADVLRALRLRRLAEGRAGRWARREGARAAARRLRLALASHWARASWLHAALQAYLPRALRPLYEEAVVELRRALPRLAARLPVPSAPAPRPDPLAEVAESRGADAPGPWLAWAPGGPGDARWRRRLGALLHVRALCPAAAPAPPPAAPDRWCAARAHDARQALADLLLEAGKRPVFLCGAGAGAALAVWLAAGGAGAGGAGAGAGGAARVKGLVLLAPPLLTAEGPRDTPDDILEEVEVPLLAVAGGAGAAGGSGAAGALAGRSAARRVLLLAGADDALRVPPRVRRRLRLPQHAIDAAVAEECARWALDAADAPAPPPRDRERRRAGAGLVSAAPEPHAPPAHSRSIEIVEGRVVSRVAGGSPLTLLAPRRAPAAPGPAPGAPGPAPGAAPELAAADIMQLPIVFADDEPAPAAPAPLTEVAVTEISSPSLTVTSGNPRAPAGALQVTRVIVAKRGARGAGAGRGAGAAGRPQLRAARPPRPVLLRRRAAPLPPAE